MNPSHIAIEHRVLNRIILKQVEATPAKTYLSFLNEKWTYEAFFRESQALARGLSSIGVKSQTRVVILMANRSEFMVAYWALAFLNAVLVPVNTALRGDALAYMFSDADASVALVDGDLMPGVQALKTGQTPSLKSVVVLDKPVSGICWPGMHLTGYRDLVSAGQGHMVLCESAHFDDLHMVSYTSGTTGPAKGVMIPYAQSIQTSLTCIDAVGIRSDDIIFAPLPLFHGMSRTMGTIPALLLGAHAHIAPRFSGSTFWKTVAEVKATVAVTIFTIPPTLKSQPPSPLDRAHNLRVMFNAHHDPEFEDRFGTQIVEAHGMTEVGLTVYSPFPERRDGSSGRAAPDWEVQIVDEFDRPLPAGETGEMVMRPKKPFIMMKGYLNKPEQTASTWRNLWFHSGDFMRADEDGFIYFAGRKKERIRRRGENISAYDIESCVDQHPEVVESAAVAYPAADGEDEVRLVVVTNAGSTLSKQELAAWLDEQLAKFMQPRFIEFVPELPKTGSGKLEKYRIMESELAGDCWDRQAVPQPARETSHA